METETTTASRKPFTTEHVTLKTITIEVQPAGDYWRDNYGILLESASVHAASGRGFHNPSFNHVVQVWENRPAKGGPHKGEVVTPDGKLTDETHTVCLKAQPTVISAHPGEPLKYGPALSVGTRVRLEVGGYPIGEYVVQARQLADPILVPAS
jgi:hypothetical protein